MRRTKADTVADLLMFIKGLDEGAKTLSYMTALLVSWENMGQSEADAIVIKTISALNYYEATNLHDYDKTHH